MNKFFFVFFFLFSISSQAHHIVGGDLTISAIDSVVQYQYRIRMTFLFDQINGSPEAEDFSETVSTFEKSTNLRLQSFTLNKISNNTYLPYTSAACNTAELKTRIIIYEAVVSFLPNMYNNINGYYVSWERCCRSDDIFNIVDPDQSGVVFYAEFPAVIKNGGRFIDSTPRFTHMKGDYACIDTYYFLDFSASDKDNDSLSYKLTVPLRGSSTADDPAPVYPSAGPYALVTFANGAFDNGMIPGPLNLSIDEHTGLVKGIASTPGEYVFAVTCSEYRNHKKIGETRRDYVFLVKADCQKYTSPEIGLKDGHTLFTGETDTLTLQDTKVDLLHVFAIDSSNTDINIKFLIGNFPLTDMSYSSITGHVRGIHDTVATTAQWKDCGNNPLAVYKVYAVASKFACPVSLTDTLTIWFKILPPLNSPPHIYTSLVDNATSVYTNELLTFPVFANDADAGDQITLSRMHNLGFQGGLFRDTSGLSPIQSSYKWIPQCDEVRNNPFHKVYFLAKDNSCYENNRDTVIVTIKSLEQSFDLSPLTFYNLATPNGDHENDELIIPKLPAGNCDHQFLSIEIYNRYGSRVYLSSQPVESIPVDYLSDGVYYYLVNYTNDEGYKGWVHVVR